MKTILFKPSQRFILALTLVLLFFLRIENISAQNYQLTIFNAPYSDLTNDISLNNGLIWWDNQYTIPLGFSYNFMGQSFTEVSTWLTGGTLKVPISGTSINLIFSPIGAGLLDKGYEHTLNNVGQSGSLSPFSYAIDGTAGNRILKIQWKNAGFAQDYTDDFIYSDSINYQVWFYEADSSLEYRYGPNFMSNAYDCIIGVGMEVGFYLYDTTNFEFDGFLLNGNPTTPTLTNVYFDGTNSVYADINDTIPQGTVYRFGPQPVATTVTNFTDKGMLNVHPNPTTGILHISSIDVDKINQIEIWNSVGQKCMELIPSAELDISELVPGIYSIRVLTDDGVYVSKLQKQ